MDTTIVATGNAVVSAINIIWPLIASIITYIIGHWATTRISKK